MSSLTVTIGYIIDHVIEVSLQVFLSPGELKFLTVPKLQTLSLVLGLSGDPPYLAVIWRPISHLIAWQRHFSLEETPRGFRSLCKGPKTNPVKSFLISQGCPRILLPTSSASASLPLEVLQSPSQAPSLSAFPLPLLDLLCLTFRLPPRFVWQLPLLHKFPSLLQIHIL